LNSHLNSSKQILIKLYIEKKRRRRESIMRVEICYAYITYIVIFNVSFIFADIIIFIIFCGI